MAKPNFRNILLLFIVFSLSALIIVSVTYYIGKKRMKLEKKSVTLTTAGVDNKQTEMMSGIKYSGLKEGRIVWELNSSSAVKDKQSGIIALTGVKFVYRSDTGMNYYITSKSGTYDEPNGTLKAVDNVFVHTEDGYTFNAKEASYSLRSRTLSAAGNIELKSGALKVSGSDLAYDVDKQALRITGNVKTMFNKEAKRK